MYDIDLKEHEHECLSFPFRLDVSDKEGVRRAVEWYWGFKNIDVLDAYVSNHGRVTTFVIFDWL